MVEGGEAWRGYRDMIRDGSGSWHNVVIDLVIADKCAAARLVYPGTHTGPLLECDFAAELGRPSK